MLNHCPNRPVGWGFHAPWPQTALRMNGDPDHIRQLADLCPNPARAWNPPHHGSVAGLPAAFGKDEDQEGCWNLRSAIDREVCGVLTAAAQVGAVYFRDIDSLPSLSPPSERSAARRWAGPRKLEELRLAGNPGPGVSVASKSCGADSTKSHFLHPQWYCVRVADSLQLLTGPGDAPEVARGYCDSGWSSVLINLSFSVPRDLGCCVTVRGTRLPQGRPRSNGPLLWVSHSLSRASCSSACFSLYSGSLSLYLENSSVKALLSLMTLGHYYWTLRGR